MPRNLIAVILFLYHLSGITHYFLCVLYRTRHGDDVSHTVSETHCSKTTHRVYNEQYSQQNKMKKHFAS